jgi:hypothetical protein
MGRIVTDTESIITAMERAFTALSRGIVTLHEAEVIDHYGTDAERRKARTRDTEKDWRDVPDASIEECPNALPHLDPVSWRFYLPAFMRFGLRTMRSPRSSIDRAIYSLALGDDRELNDYQRERFKTLDSGQAHVVHRFLEFAARNDAHCDGHIARQAVEKYWSRASGV